MSYNYNIAKPKVYEVDKTVRSLKEFRNIDGQNYITISAAAGRKLMQRLPDRPTGPVERVLARGQDEEEEYDEKPDFILIESKEYAKQQKEICGGGYLHKQFETTKLELTSLQFYQALLAEFIGVFILTLVVCGIGISLNGSKVASINGALGGGLCLSTMIWCMNCISGGNLNPAISIALVITQDLVLVRGIFYIAFQLLGAYSGAASLKFLLPANATVGIGITNLNNHVSLAKGFGVEFLITFILAFTVYASIDKKRKDLGGSIPLSIGLSVTCGALFGGPYTGGSMNPARSFGPAALNNFWINHWIYWVGPVSGAIVAGLLYKVFGVKFVAKTTKDSK